MKELEDLVKKLEDMIELQKRAKSFSGDILKTTFHRNSEDGILNYIHKANSKQLSTIINSFRWQYYREYNDKDVLVAEIRNRVRSKKLESLL